MTGGAPHPYAAAPGPAGDGAEARGGYELRAIERREDLIAFAQLRYRVWLKEGYVPPDTLPNVACLELDVADYYARHFGVFGPDGGLLGGGRLIFEEPENGDDWIRLVNDIAIAHPDPVLTRRLNRPYFALPSDLYAAFPEFLDDYKAMFDQGVRVAEVSRVVLTEDLRGRGVSGHLMIELIRQAEAFDVGVLLLTCAVGLEPFYMQFGFQRHHGVPSGAYGDIEIESIVMSLRLRN